MTVELSLLRNLKSKVWRCRY